VEQVHDKRITKVRIKLPQAEGEKEHKEANEE
jgi:hypothetical protein